MIEPSNLDERKLLGKIYVKQVSGDPMEIPPLELFDGPEMDLSETHRIVEGLELRGLIRKNGGHIELTPEGRSRITVVMSGGAFDILHPGHIETLEKAKEMGDILVVSIARNSTIERNKGRKPLHDEMLRRRLVSAIRFVDLAILGSEKSIFDTVELLKPDVIALGYDQFHSEQEIREEVERRGIGSRIVRLESSVPKIKTSKILSENKDLFASN